MISFIKWVKTIVLVSSLIFMGIFVSRQWDQIKSYDISPDYLLLSLSMFVLLFTFLLGAAGWHRILIAFGGNSPLKTNLKIWALSSMTRYLPGGIWGYVSRAALCKEAGISLSIAMAGLYVETFLLFLSSLVTGLPAAISVTGFSIPFEYLLLAGITASLLINPRLFKYLQNISGKTGSYFRQITIPTQTHMAGLYFYYLIILVIYGIAFLLFVSALMPSESEAWITTASVFPLAFCAGFVLFIFPSGIGIRESVIYLLLSGIIGPTGSIIIAIASRIWTIIVEIIFILAIYLYINSGRFLPHTITHGRH